MQQTTLGNPTCCHTCDPVLVRMVYKFLFFGDLCHLVMVSLASERNCSRSLLTPGPTPPCPVSQQPRQWSAGFQSCRRGSDSQVSPWGLTDAHRHSPLDPRIPNSSFRLGTFVGFSQFVLISMLSVQIYQYSFVFLFHLRDLLDANPNPKHSLIIHFSTESLKERGKLQSQNECRPEIMPSTATLGSCGLLSSVSRACTGGDGSHTMPGLTFLQRCRVQHRETKSQPRRAISCGFTGMPLPSSQAGGECLAQPTSSQIHA